MENPNDFSESQERKKKFKDLPPEQQAKVIDAAQTEGALLHKMVGPTVDRLTLQANLAERIGEEDKAEISHEEIRKVVSEKIRALDTETKEIVMKIISGLDKAIPNDYIGLDLEVGTLQSPQMNLIARVLGKEVQRIYRVDVSNNIIQSNPEDAIEIGRMNNQIVIITQLGKLHLLTEAEWADAIEKGSQSKVSN